MNTNSQKTEAEEKREKARAILAIKFDTVSTGTVLYWHYKSIIG
jgi:hypothetical protein